MDKKVWTAALVCLAGLVATPAFAQAKKPADAPPAGQKPAAKPAAAPATTKPAAPIAIGAEVDQTLGLTDADGKLQMLKDHRGKIVVLHFIGIQSATTANYVARLKKLNEEFSGKGVEFLAVDANHGDADWTDKEPTKRVREWATKQGLNGVMFDKGHLLADRLNATVNGHTFVIDAKGMLRYAGTLDDDPKGEHAERAGNYLKEALDAIIAGKTPEKATTPAVGDPIVREARPAEPVKKDEKKPVPAKKEEKPNKKPAPKKS